MKTRKERKPVRSGMAIIVAMIFVVLFSALAVTMFATSSTNMQAARNQVLVNKATNAAMSGLDCAKYVIKSTPSVITSKNIVSDAEANQIWTNFCSYLQTNRPGGATVGNVTNFTDSGGSGQSIVAASIATGDAGSSISLKFYRYTSDPRTIYLESAGTSGNITRKIAMNLQITKESSVLEFAIAGRGRMWVTQNSVINGPIYSSWNKPSVGAGIETTADTTVNGTISTKIKLEDLRRYNIQMETLDQNNDPVFDQDGNRVYSPADTVQGAHEGINYNITLSTMAGMKPEDYDTSSYKTGCSTLGTYDRTQVEYFPHSASGYNYTKSSASKKYTRKVYENKTFRNITIPKGTNALFKNCTFEEVLFVETAQTYSDSSTSTNNIRFEDCNFAGVITTDVPGTSSSSTWWMRNVLYFTGDSVFNNHGQDATIVAPNFNVNIGNTGRLEAGSGNVLNGAVIGGIVDVRGNAEVKGTIISMYDTSYYTSGYVTNIGAADDGGDESIGYVGGQITITPDPAKLLPSGMKSAIIIKPATNTYREI